MTAGAYEHPLGRLAVTLPARLLLFGSMLCLFAGLLGVVWTPLGVMMLAAPAEFASTSGGPPPLALGLLFTLFGMAALALGSISLVTLPASIVWLLFGNNHA